MRSFFVVLAAMAATVISGGPAAAESASFRKMPSAKMAAKLHPARGCRRRKPRQQGLHRADGCRSGDPLRGRRRGICEDRAGEGRALRRAHERGADVCRAPRRAAGRAAREGRRHRRQDLQLPPRAERLRRPHVAAAGGQAAQGQVGPARVGRPRDAARDGQHLAFPGAAQPGRGPARQARAARPGRHHRRHRFRHRAGTSLAR